MIAKEDADQLQQQIIGFVTQLTETVKRTNFSVTSSDEACAQWEFISVTTNNYLVAINKTIKISRITETK